MSSPPPTKPPRGVKQGKETSGLLMSVIRTLSASETNEQREKERAKLEKEYKKSDAKLDELVAAHATEIMEVMQKFSAVGQALALWGQHCDAATARLAACRGLLRLRRDDLKRLWMTARTHHYALQMLTDIERVVVLSRSARSARAAGFPLSAAHSLTSAESRVNTQLAHVTALSHTRHHLQDMKMSLVDDIVGNIRRCVYRGELQNASHGISSRRRAAALLAELTKSEDVTDAYLQDITPEFEASLTEEDKTFETTVMVSLEALGVLEQLQEATEKFKVEIQNELLEVIDTVSRRIIDEGDVEIPECEEDDDISDSESVTEMGRPLVRLITILGEEFKACASRNKRLIQLWRAALNKHKLSDTCLHTEQHFWSAVQQVMQLLLTEYLDIESVVNLSSTRSQAVTASFSDTLRLSDYFAKKRPQRRRPELFKLNSPVAISRGAGRRQRYPLVEAPRPELLHVIMPPLHQLCTLVEARPGVGECSLRAFVADYVRTGESERLAAVARQHVERALAASGAWTERTQHNGRVVYACCVSSWRAIRGAARGARACGPCGGSAAARATLAPIGALAAGARAAHGRRVPGGSRAARWLADDDIARFLQSLPNWRAALQPQHAAEPQELKQAYEREAEILSASLGDGVITKNEIISSPDILEDIAVLCESMDWLAIQIRSIPSILTGGGAGGIKVSEKFVNDINSAAMIFDEISHKCLLLLHLEVRIECFHYLCGGAGAGGEDSSEGEGGAQLGRALLTVAERAGVLRDSALAYVVRGAAEMMSAGVVVARRRPASLAALRHCLAALQLPHDGLQRAHDYLRLLDRHPQEIIAIIREKGAQFSELEYLNAFKVIGSKKAIPQLDMKQYLKQLSDALGHVGVTV